VCSRSANPFISSTRSKAAFAPWTADLIRANTYLLFRFDASLTIRTHNRRARWSLHDSSRIDSALDRGFGAHGCLRKSVNKRQHTSRHSASSRATLRPAEHHLGNTRPASPKASHVAAPTSRGLVGVDLRTVQHRPEHPDIESPMRYLKPPEANTFVTT